MDAYLTIVGKREVRRYRSRSIPEDALTQILEAGRASGSSRNRQPWRFIVMTDRTRLRALAPLVSRPANLAECAAAVVLALTNPRAQFDAGRTAQNMMLAAWSLGIGSCPNTPANESAMKALLGVPEEMSVPTILSLGYPARGEPRPRADANPEGLLARINRLPLADVVRRETHPGSART